MIIVSQDETELINFNNIVRLGVDVNANGEFLIEAHNFCDDFETVIGFYKTEERAKEVLQEIIKAIVENRKAKDANDFFGFPTMQADTYYEMPKQ